VTGASRGIGRATATALAGSWAHVLLPYIANLELAQRFAENAPLAEVDWETVHASGPHGYSDYPTHQSTEHNPGAEYAKDNTQTEQGDRSRSL
jgi:NAD(P)-dependent dehydrogenase (short-subunit alcohol dehydrogenase family)